MSRPRRSGAGVTGRHPRDDTMPEAFAIYTDRSMARQPSPPAQGVPQEDVGLIIDNEYFAFTKF